MVYFISRVAMLFIDASLHDTNAILDYDLGTFFRKHEHMILTLATRRESSDVPFLCSLSCQ